MKPGDLVKLRYGRNKFYRCKAKEGSLGVVLGERRGLTRIDYLVTWGDITEWVFIGTLEVVNEAG